MRCSVPSSRNTANPLDIESVGPSGHIGGSLGERCDLSLRRSVAASSVGYAHVDPSGGFSATEHTASISLRSESYHRYFNPSSEPYCFGWCDVLRAREGDHIAPNQCPTLHTHIWRAIIGTLVLCKMHYPCWTEATPTRNIWHYGQVLSNVVLNVHRTRCSAQWVSSTFRRRRASGVRKAVSWRPL